MNTIGRSYSHLEKGPQGNKVISPTVYYNDEIAGQFNLAVGGQDHLINCGSDLVL